MAVIMKSQVTILLNSEQMKTPLWLLMNLYIFYVLKRRIQSTCVIVCPSYPLLAAQLYVRLEGCMLKAFVSSEFVCLFFDDIVFVLLSLLFRLD